MKATLVASLLLAAGCAASPAAGPGGAPATPPAAAAPAPARAAPAPGGAPPAPALPRLVGPAGDIPMPAFTEEEEAKDVAVKTLRQTEAASYHIVRLRKAEVPHTHEHSELSVTVLSGEVRMHLADRVIPVGPGDVIDIPKGTPHWAENAGQEPAFAHAVFSPALRPDDRRPVSGALAP